MTAVARSALASLALLVALGLLGSPRPAAAQSAPGGGGESFLKSVFFRLPGTWEGEGNVGGYPSRITMTWAPAFDGRFIRVTWRNVMTTKDGRELHFEGEGTYAPVPDERGVHAGTWFDSQGKVRTLRARAAGDSLVTEWTAPDTAPGRTTYRLLPGGTMTVRDEIQGADSWATFGVSTFRKAPAAAH